MVLKHNIKRNGYAVCYENDNKKHDKTFLIKNNNFV